MLNNLCLLYEYTQLKRMISGRLAHMLSYSLHADRLAKCLRMAEVWAK